MPQPMLQKNGVETKSVKKKIQQTLNTDVVWVNNPTSALMLDVGFFFIIYIAKIELCKVIPE